MYLCHKLKKKKKKKKKKKQENKNQCMSVPMIFPHFNRI